MLEFASNSSSLSLPPHSKSTIIAVSCFFSQFQFSFSSNTTSLLIKIFYEIGSYSLYAFDLSLTPTKIHFKLLSSSFVYIALGTWTWEMHPKTLKYSIDGLIPLQACFGVLFLITSVGVSFKTWMIQLTTSGHKVFGIFLQKHASNHIHNGLILTFCYPIMLWGICSR